MPRKISLQEVSRHNTMRDCWVVINGNVYDMSSFIDDHPGGAKVVMLYAGNDATEEFTMLHKPSIIKQFGPRLLVGTLA